jgi:drug/metabolite transporter (DMT)-like permease
MLYLLGATAFSSLFGLILRRAMDRGRNPWAVGVLNYVVATGIQVARYLSARPLVGPEPRTLWLGVATGVLYAVNFLLFIPLLRLRGVSVTSAMLRLAVIFPILASLWFGERVTPWQTAGVVLSLAALPLLTLKPGQRLTIGDRRAVGLLLLLLAGNGASMVLFKVQQQGAGPGQEALFLMTLFGTAMIVAGAVWALHARGTGRRDVLPGVGLGATNSLANWGLAASLGVLPGILVFPVYSAGGLVVTALLARLWVGERINRLEAAGMVVAVAAVTLANLA